MQPEAAHGAAGRRRSISWRDRAGPVSLPLASDEGAPQELAPRERSFPGPLADVHEEVRA